MRTTLDIPEELINEARRVLGFKSKTDAVVLSLTELIRRRRIDELKAMAGQVKLDLDVSASRRRPQRAATSVKRRGRTGRSA
jgi:Arc/MetJ family transcription regulator